MKAAHLALLSALTLAALLRTPAVAYASNSDIFNATLSPALQRFAVQPQFSTLESRLTIVNNGKDALFSIESIDETDMVTIQNLALNAEQKWMPLIEPLFIPEGASKTITQVVNPRPPVTIGDITIETTTSVRPVYIPTTIEKKLTIEPTFISKIILSVTENGMTTIRPKIALFTNRNGTVFLSDNKPESILLVQNKDTFALPISGTITVHKPSGQRKAFPLHPQTIPANNQAYMRIQGSTTPDVTLPLFGDGLEVGEYKITAELNTNSLPTPNLFAEYSFWVIPEILIYTFVTFIVIILLIGFTQSIQSKHDV